MSQDSFDAERPVEATAKPTNQEKTEGTPRRSRRPLRRRTSAPASDAPAEAVAALVAETPNQNGHSAASAAATTESAPATPDATSQPANGEPGASAEAARGGRAPSRRTRGRRSGPRLVRATADATDEQGGEASEPAGAGEPAATMEAVQPEQPIIAEPRSASTTGEATGEIPQSAAPAVASLPQPEPPRAEAPQASESGAARVVPVTTNESRSEAAAIERATPRGDAAATETGRSAPTAAPTTPPSTGATVEQPAASERHDQPAPRRYRFDRRPSASVAATASPRPERLSVGRETAFAPQETPETPETPETHETPSPVEPPAISATVKAPAPEASAAPNVAVERGGERGLLTFDLAPSTPVDDIVAALGLHDPQLAEVAPARAASAREEAEPANRAVEAETAGERAQVEGEFSDDETAQELANGAETEGEAQANSRHRRRRRRRGGASSQAGATQTSAAGETEDDDGLEPGYEAGTDRTPAYSTDETFTLDDRDLRGDRSSREPGRERSNGYDAYAPYESFDDFDDLYAPYTRSTRERADSRTEPRNETRNERAQPAAPANSKWDIGEAQQQIREPASPFGAPEPSFARGFGPQPRGVAGQPRETYGRSSNRVDTPPMSANQLGATLTNAIQQQTDRLLNELRRQQQPPSMTVMFPPQPSTERVGVFVDVANLLYSARSLRISLDFGRLLDFLRGNRRLIRAQAYAPTNPEPHAEQAFLSAVKGLGYRITTKNYKTFASGAKKADMDLDLCMDIVRLVDAGALDTVVLVSGDSDFLPLLEYCSDHGVRVEVAAFEDAAAAILRQSCDLFINLSLVDDIRA